METPSRHSQSIGPANPAHQGLYGDASVAQPNAPGFSGRVFGEVWSDGTVRVGTSDPALLRPALIVLQHDPVVRPAAPTLPTAPTMGLGGDVSSTSSGTATYLGRALVEFWTTGAVVTVSGGNGPQVLTGLTQRLQQLALSV